MATMISHQKQKPLSYLKTHNMLKKSSEYNSYSLHSLVSQKIESLGSSNL